MGVGASAGGLEAFRQLLHNLPADTGMAFVLVQHLDPKHDSILAPLLSRSTPMPVREATHGAKVEPNHVFVIPPGAHLAIADGHLQLLPRTRSDRGAPMPIDQFLRTLAEVHGAQAIGVILSGTASDGTLGCKAIKAAGGIAFAQDPATAKYDGMPRSAIAAGCVDAALSPEGIARELARLARHPYIRDAGDRAAPPVESKDGLKGILVRLKRSTGVDFTSYKKTTLLRRIQRRMTVHKLDTLEEYGQFLGSHASEAEELYDDLLIVVTSFFRDPEVFQALARHALPRILKGRAGDAPIRVWVPGCATGEEAYSITMCLLENLSSEPANPPIQVFGTDLSEKAIAKARAAIYLENIASDVSPERLARFFVKVDGRYQVSKTVRDMCIFAKHNLIRDPPFSRLDLVSCRNVLIYLESTQQKQVLSSFHYALEPSGFLMLGRSETVTTAADLFNLEDREHRLYSNNPTAPRAVHFAAGAGAGGAELPRGPRRTAGEESDSGSHLQKEADRILLSRYSPAAVLVDDRLSIVQFRGLTEAYLQHGPGDASLNLLRMARKELQGNLREAIQQARAQGSPVRRDSVTFRHGRQLRAVSFEVLPIKEPTSGKPSFLVLFEEGEPTSEHVKRPMPTRPRHQAESASQRRIAELEQELASVRLYEESLAREHEAYAEEVQSANEEILSSNEELQSINEELETAKEELQSTNEELTTVNDELSNRNAELASLNDDLANILASARIPIVVLGADMRIRRFTPAAAPLLNLIPTDVGRPLTNLNPNVEVPGLDQLILEVTETITVAEHEVKDRDGRWYSLQIRPYKTRDNRIDGAVLAFVDIDDLKRAALQIAEARDYSEAIVKTAREALVILDGELRVQSANRRFYELFHTAPPETEGRYFYQVGTGQWDVPRLRSLLEEVLPQDSHFDDFEIEADFPGIGRRVMVLNGRRLEQKPGAGGKILLAIEDRTEITRADAEKARLLRDAEQARQAEEAANRLKDDFLATVSHELRGPLNVMNSWSHILEGGVDQANQVRGLAVIRRAIHQQTRLIEDILDVSRIMAGKLRIAAVQTDLKSIVEAALQNVRPAAEAKGIRLELLPDSQDERVLGDPDRLQQVIWNLLANAVKFTGPGGRVIVSLGREGNAVQVRVSDTGQGIGAGFLPHVFERFRQADGSSSRAHGGLGLGLSIVKHVVELHGGTVVAESKGQDQGSTFTVLLPVPALLSQAGESPAMPSSGEAPVGTPCAGALQGISVLLVDDDEDSRDALASVLERHGARLEKAGSVREALGALDRSVPDVLVSDLGMPGEDGYDLIRKVRASPPEHGGSVPALAVTGFAASVMRQRAIAAGYHDYVVKPAEPSQLVTSVARLAGRTLPS